MALAAMSLTDWVYRPQFSLLKQHNDGHFFYQHRTEQRIGYIAPIAYHFVKGMT